jgi:hypothetical protein
VSGTGVAFAAETLDLAVKGATAYEREDLVERLTGARHLLSDTAVTVYVVGEFKQGKSSLINGLLTTPGVPGGRRHRHRRPDQGRLLADGAGRRELRVRRRR